MHVSAHKYAALHHLLGLETAAYGEGLVHAHKGLYPWIYEQVVSDGNLARCGEACLVKHEVQYGTVQHNVPVVGDKELVVAVGDSVVVEGVASCILLEYVAYNVLHETQLEIERSLHANEHHSEQAIAHSLGQPRCKSLHHLVEMAVAKQLV